MDIHKILTTKVARINFLKGLIRVSRCDGIKDENELFFYHQAATALGLSEEEKEKLDCVWKEDDKIEVSFEKSSEKMFFFVQAIQLCWIDDNYADKERQEIRVIAWELGISEEAIVAVESWVREGVEWNLRGEQLLELQ